MLFAQFSWYMYWPSASWEDIKISSMYFFYFVIISSWKRVGPSFEQIWICFTKGCFVPNVVDFGTVVFDEIFKILSFFFYFVIISPWKRAWPFILTKLNPFIQGCFVPSLYEIGPVVLEKKINMRTAYRQTDHGQQVLELSAQVS